MAETEDDILDAFGAAKDEAEDEEEKEPAVGLAQRAFPLIELLTAAAAAHDDVVWQ